MIDATTRELIEEVYGCVPDVLADGIANLLNTEGEEPAPAEPRSSSRVWIRPSPPSLSP